MSAGSASTTEASSSNDGLGLDTSDIARIGATGSGGMSIVVIGLLLLLGSRTMSIGRLRNPCSPGGPEAACPPRDRPGQRARVTSALAG